MADTDNNIPAKEPPVSSGIGNARAAIYSLVAAVCIILASLLLSSGDGIVSALLIAVGVPFFALVLINRKALFPVICIAVSAAVGLLALGCGPVVTAITCAGTAVLAFARVFTDRTVENRFISDVIMYLLMLVLMLTMFATLLISAYGSVPEGIEQLREGMKTVLKETFEVLNTYGGTIPADSADQYAATISDYTFVLIPGVTASFSVMCIWAVNGIYSLLTRKLAGLLPKPEKNIPVYVSVTYVIVVLIGLFSSESTFSFVIMNIELFLTTVFFAEGIRQFVLLIREGKGRRMTFIIIAAVVLAVLAFYILPQFIAYFGAIRSMMNAIRKKINNIDRGQE